VSKFCDAFEFEELKAQKQPKYEFKQLHFCCSVYNVVSKHVMQAYEEASV